MATDLISLTGAPTALEVTFTGPRIQVAGREDWVAPTCEPETAWLDLKGAFLDPLGERPFYQLKNPWQRAQRLHERGEA